jgi:PqqD family protein of HPr-rel-A system
VIPDRIVWRVASRTPLRWRGWDGEWVVYHPDSGDTHLLDPLAAEALRSLEASPAGAAALVERLAGSADATGVEELGAAVERMLRVFDEVGLIEPVDDPA